MCTEFSFSQMTKKTPLKTNNIREKKVNYIRVNYTDYVILLLTKKNYIHYDILYMWFTKKNKSL